MSMTTTNLIDYIRVHAVQGGEDKTADLVFFKVSAAKGADAEELRAAIKTHVGHHCECDPLDGNEHGYLEIGGWIGDRGLALMLMGLGSLLGLWQLLTPRAVLGDLPDDLVREMAGRGLITIVAPKAAEAACDKALGVRS